MSKPGADPSSGISFGGCTETAPSDIRHIGGAKLNQALVRNVRTWPAMPREKAQAAPTARLKVPMRRRGADWPLLRALAARKRCENLLAPATHRFAAARS